MVEEIKNNLEKLIGKAPSVNHTEVVSEISGLIIIEFEYKEKPVGMNLIDYSEEDGILTLYSPYHTIPREIIDYLIKTLKSHPKEIDDGTQFWENIRIENLRN